MRTSGHTRAASTRLGIIMIRPSPVSSTESTSTNSLSLRPSVLFKPAQARQLAATLKPTAAMHVGKATAAGRTGDKHELREAGRHADQREPEEEGAQLDVAQELIVQDDACPAMQGLSMSILRKHTLLVRSPGRANELRKAVQQRDAANEFGSELQCVGVEVEPGPSAKVSGPSLKGKNLYTMDEEQAAGRSSQCPSC